MTTTTEATDILQALTINDDVWAVLADRGLTYEADGVSVARLHHVETAERDRAAALLDQNPKPRPGRPYGVPAVHTNRMTLVQLARVWADHFGYEARSGGWVYDETGHPVAHGWESFAGRLAARAYIEVGVGVHWRRVDIAKEARRNWRP